MFMWVRALQLIVNLPMLRVMEPANVIMVYNIINKIVMFDILGNSKGINANLIFDFDLEEQKKSRVKILDQMEFIGYLTTNCILNL